MEIAFDPAKSERNREERGFGFSYAAKIFAGRPMISPAKPIGGEAWMKAVGEIEGKLYAVVLVDRGDVRRIISARPASRRERRIWPRSG